MEEVGDTQRGAARARAALDEARGRSGQPVRRRSRPTPAVDLRAVPEPQPEAIAAASDADARIAALEAEVRALRAALARIGDASRDALSD